MTRMYEPLQPAETDLLGTIFDGYSRAGRRWPVWQYVRHQYSHDGLDAERVLAGLPVWQHGYRPVHTANPGLAPAPDQPVALTFVGLQHVPGPAAQGLSRAVTAALQTMVAAHLALEPDPTQVQKAEIEGTALTQRVNELSGANLSATQLHDLLQYEPPFWAAVRGPDGGWSYEATSVPLARYAGVQTASDLVTALEVVLGHPPDLPSRRAPLPAEALPEALDHLNLAWQVHVTKRPLIRMRSASAVGTLVLPVDSSHEFAVGVTALADLLNAFDIPTHQPATPAGSLNRLAAVLASREAPRHAIEAVKILRAVIDVRNAASHPGAMVKFARAYQTLGVDVASADWSHAWEAVRHATVTALRDIRLGLQETYEPMIIHPANGA